MFPTRLAVVLGVAMIAAPPWQVAAPAAQPSKKTATDMKAHFGEVTAVHEAVIRGDLDSAKKAAAALANRQFDGLPDVTKPQREAMQSLARQVAGAGDFSAAAAGAAAMLGACGDCHRAAGVVPVMTLPKRPVVGETVGHMLDHQRAVDQLMRGLAIPSSSLWHQGAQSLRAAPLNPGKLPKDPKLTGEVAENEQRVHTLADDATSATETSARVAVYGQLIGTCASCHSIHSNIWGPSGR